MPLLLMSSGIFTNVLPILFGTWKNAVFNQLCAALMTYVVHKWLYSHAKSYGLPCKSIPLIRFKEQIQHKQVQVEWVIAIARVLDWSDIKQKKQIFKLIVREC